MQRMWFVFFYKYQKKEDPCIVISSPVFLLVVGKLEYVFADKGFGCFPRDV